MGLEEKIQNIHKIDREEPLPDPLIGDRLFPKLKQA